MLKIGLTGGIGSGKTTVAKMFESLGVPVYYADERAKTLQNQSPLKEQIIALLGPESYENGMLQRKKVASVVFQNRDLLEKLNDLVHPAVAQDFSNWLNQQHGPYIVKEAAIIFEISAADQYDQIVLVTADEEVRIERVMQRDHSSRDEVMRRIRNQMSDDDKKKRAHHIIVNRDIEEVKSQVGALHQAFISNTIDTTK